LRKGEGRVIGGDKEVTTLFNFFLKKYREEKRKIAEGR